MKKVIVTHAGGRLGLAMSRGLKCGPKPVHVVAADAGKYDLHRAVGDEKVLLPKAGEAAYLPVVRDLIRETRPDFFWPAHDAEIAVVSTEPELQDITFLPPADMVRTCQSKMLSHEKFAAAGVPVPRSMPVQDQRDLARAFEEFGGDIWVRATRGVGGRGSLPVKDFETAKMWIDFNRGWGNFLAAERLSGQRVSMDMIWHEGELMFCQGIIPMAIGFSNLTLSGITGIPALNKWVDVPAMNETALAAVSAVHDRPHGIMGVDMTYHADGTPRVTEINIGRFGSGGTVNSRALGFNIPYLVMQLATGEDPDMPLPSINQFPHDWWIIFGMSVEPVEIRMSEVEDTAFALEAKLKRLGF
jgi:carbamoyl-phosphate synthase large subunit